MVWTFAASLVTAGSWQVLVVVGWSFVREGKVLDFVDRESNLGSFIFFQKIRSLPKGEYSFIHSLFIVDYYQ